MDPAKRIAVLREGGCVQRAHTMPHHGEYTVGKHSFDAVNLLFVLHPDPPMHLVKAVLWHDIGERWTGDVPATAKWSDGELAKRLDMLESRCLKAAGLEQTLSPEERLWLRAVDRIELLLWAKEQLAMGNLNANAIIGNLASWFKRTAIPVQCKNFVENHKWGRTPDELP